MDYTEIQTIRPILAKLRAAEANTHVELDEAEYAIVCDRIKGAHIMEYNRAFDVMVQSVLNSQSAAPGGS
jgi:hypothetical protein